MKLSQIAFAALALSVGASAFAGTERISGASASSVNVAKGLRNLCVAAGGSYKLYKTASSASSLGNIFTGTCTGGVFTGTTDQVRVNVANGSLSAVLNATAGGNTAIPLIDPAAATCTAIAGGGTGALAFALNGELQNCNATGQVNETVEGGYLDVEGSIFRANNLSIPASVVDSTDYVASPFYQAFGVAVSIDLYKALQAHQVAKGQLPVACGSVAGTVYSALATPDTSPSCQPNVSRALLTWLFASGSNGAKLAGANSLIGGTATVKNDLTGASISPDVALKTKITYCRRPATSGTQASTQLYFLNAPTGGGELGGQLTAVGSPTAPGSANVGTAFTVTTNSGSGDVKNCLNAAGHAVGTISLENNPIGGSDTYRFVKLNNQSGSEGVLGASQTGEAIAGRYDFVYQTYQYCPGGACSPILTALNTPTALPAGASTAGLYLASETNFKRAKATAPLIAK